uniref:Uncharacterized protein n=1 Tax=Oryza nivara TaxID=4536 RepID=A0A0E0FQL2_ORYNI
MRWSPRRPSLRTSARTPPQLKLSRRLLPPHVGTNAVRLPAAPLPSPLSALPPHPFSEHRSPASPPHTPARPRHGSFRVPSRHRRPASSAPLLLPRVVPSLLAEEVVGLALPNLHRVDVGERRGVLEHGVEAAESRGVVLAEERGWLAQHVQAPDDLLGEERRVLLLLVTVVFGPRLIAVGSPWRGARRGAVVGGPELLLLEEVALSFPDPPRGGVVLDLGSATCDGREEDGEGRKKTERKRMDGKGDGNGMVLTS